jgi:hypothetical protein
VRLAYLDAYVRPALLAAIWTMGALYRLPPERTIENWARANRGSFRLCIELP